MENSLLHFIKIMLVPVESHRFLILWKHEFHAQRCIAYWKSMLNTEKTTFSSKSGRPTKISLRINESISGHMYIHRSKIAVAAETYLNECIQKRLILFISHYHTSDFGLFWLDLASLHYAHEVQRLPANHRIPYV